GGRPQAHPGEPAVASGAEPPDRSEDFADHPEVHAEGRQGPVPDGQRPLRSVDARDGAGRVRGAVRLLPLLAAASLVAVPAAAQEQYFEEPSAKPRFTLNWDFLARYDEVDHREYLPTLERGRFQLRPEGGVRPAPQPPHPGGAVFALSTRK